MRKYDRNISMNCQIYILKNKLSYHVASESVSYSMHHNESTSSVWKEIRMCVSYKSESVELNIDKKKIKTKKSNPKERLTEWKKIKLKKQS